jgi:hypothetical protein
VGLVLTCFSRKIWICAPTDPQPVDLPHNTPLPNLKRKSAKSATTRPTPRPINDFEEVNFFSCVVAQFVEVAVGHCGLSAFHGEGTNFLVTRPVEAGPSGRRGAAPIHEVIGARAR